ncbi:MAG: isopentenyl-diphosphate Delta-isomerase [Planctomycetota bacterium]
MSGRGAELILVNSLDRAIGYLDKERCHDGAGVLHRAFSVFLFDAEGRLLLQQRSAAKRLWPGYWSNSCCSHPRRGERIAAAARRRVREELGVRVSALRFEFKFAYHARFQDAGSERELCHVLLGALEPREITRLAPDPNEIAAAKWLAPREVNALMASKRARVTPWFRMEWQRLAMVRLKLRSRIN